MDNKPIIVEFLIIVMQEGTFCNSESAFIKFLSLDSSLSISEEKKEITLLTKKKSQISVSYFLTSGEVPSQAQRYFKLKLSGRDTNLKEYTELTTLLENLISKLHKDVSINVLWNDIARKYAVQGYELINQVENLLRRLITDFMLVNVGYDWYKSHIPVSVENRDKDLKETYSDYLHQTYFSDLKTILFEGQRDKNLRDIGQIQKLIEKHISDGKNQISIDELRGVIATSLWEKYFSKVTTYEKKDLETDLEELNSLRNEIAHNRHISRKTLGKIESLSRKIIKTLKLVIDDLPNKKLTPEEQDFQINAEIKRISNNNNTINELLIGSVVTEWYINKFGSILIKKEVPFTFNKITTRIDILIDIDSNSKIGVEVKYLEQWNLKKLERIVLSFNDILSFYSNFSDIFLEFHLVLVLGGFINNFNVSDKIINLIQSRINTTLKYQIILGFVNNSGNFELINI